MKATIDRAGRIVVPKALRKMARLEPGTELELTFVGGRIEIQARPAAVKLVRRGRLLVAEPQGPTDRLTREAVEEVRDAIRGGRGTKA